MNKKIISCLSFSALLVGCGGSSNSNNTAAVQTQPVITVPVLSAANYQVTVGDDAHVSVGQYFSGADGTRLLLVNNEQEQASTLYRADKDNHWQSIPKSDKDVTVQFQHTAALNLAPLQISTLSGVYTTIVAGKIISFSIAKDGSITAAPSSACQLSGSMTDQYTAGVNKVQIKTSNCPDLAASLSGVVIEDAAYLPMKLRFVLDDGTKLFELWAAADTP